MKQWTNTNPRPTITDGLDFDVKFEHHREYTTILIPAHKLEELKAKLLVIAKQQEAERQEERA